VNLQGAAVHWGRDFSLSWRRWQVVAVRKMFFFETVGCLRKDQICTV